MASNLERAGAALDVDRVVRAHALPRPDRRHGAERLAVDGGDPHAGANPELEGARVES